MADVAACGCQWEATCKIHSPTFQVPQPWWVTVASPASLCCFDGHTPAAEDLSPALPGCTYSVPFPSGNWCSVRRSLSPMHSTVLSTLLISSALHAGMTSLNQCPLLEAPVS